MSKKTIKDFNWRFGVKMGAVILAIGAAYGYLGSRYVVGLDTQENRCLDEWVYVIDTWHRPTAAEVQRDDYVAVALTDAQTPRNALWRAGQVMVKRAVAVQPGDQIKISRGGVTFEHGAEHWTRGTALEAATLLGKTPEDFERKLTLTDGQLFLMGDNPKSYDGRYYGPVDQNQIVGAVVWAF